MAWDIGTTANKVVSVTKNIINIVKNVFCKMFERHEVFIINYYFKNFVILEKLFSSIYRV